MEDPEVIHPNPHISATIRNQKLNDPLRQSKIMEKFRETVMKAAAFNSNPTKPFLSPSQIALIDNSLLQAFPNLSHIPSHPPYAAMIEKAVGELRKEGRLSDEVSISEYIKEHYEGLPWAHKRYLSHYLKKGCEFGELVFDHSDGGYVLPGMKRQRNVRRKKQGRRKVQRKRKVGDIQEGNIAAEKFVEVDQIQVGFQDDVQGSATKRGKRQRHSLVVDDEEVGDVGTDGGESNMISSELPVIEVQTEVLESEGGENERKASEPELLDTGIAVEDHGRVHVGRGEQQVVGFEWKCESSADKLCSKEHEVGGKAELEVTSTIVDGLTVGREVATNVLHLDDDNGDSNRMFVPIESTMESRMEKDHEHSSGDDLLLSPAMVGPLAAVSNNENVLPGRTVPDVLKEREHNLCASELMIVPFVGNTLNTVVGKQIKPIFGNSDLTIVCGLAYPKAEEPKQKPQVYHHRKRSKASQRKSKPVVEQPFSPWKGLETKRSSKLKDSQQALVLPTLKDGFASGQLGKQKRSPPISARYISMEYDENVPLKRWKKLGMPGTTLKAPSASSSSTTDAESQKELSNSESSVKTTAGIGEGLNMTKRGEKKQQQKQLKMQIRPQNGTFDDSKAVSVAVSLNETMSPVAFVNEENKSLENCEIQEPEGTHFVNDSIIECVDMEHQEKQQRESQGLHSCQRLEPTTMTSSTHNQPLELENYHQSREKQCLLTQPVTEVNRSESSPTQRQNGQEGDKEHENGNERSEAGSYHSELAIGEETMPQHATQCEITEKWGPELNKLTQQEGHDSQQWQKTKRGRPQNSAVVTEEDGLSLSSFLQEQERLSKSTTDQHQQQQRKPLRQYSRGWRQKPKDATTKDEAVSVNQHLEEQEMPSKAAIHKHSDQQNNPDSQRSPLKQTEATLEDPAVLSNLHLHELIEPEPVTDKKSALQIRELRPRKQRDALLNGQESQSEEATCHQLKRDKQTTQSTPEAAMDLSILYHKDQEAPQPASNNHSKRQSQRPKKDFRERPQIQKEATREAIDTLNLSQEQKALSEPATTHLHPLQQSKQLMKEENEEALVDPLSSIDQSHAGLCDPEISQLTSKQHKKNRGGRPQKQGEANEGQLEIQWNLVHQQEVGLVDRVKHWASKQQNNELKRARGRPRKKTKAQEEGDEVHMSISHGEQDALIDTEKGATKSNAVLSKTHNQEHEGQLEPATLLVKEASSMQCPVDENHSKQEKVDDQVCCPVSELSAMTTFLQPLGLSDQSCQQQIEQKRPRRRSARNLEPARSDLLSDSQRNLELFDGRRSPAPLPTDHESHGRDKEKRHHFPDVEPGNKADSRPVERDKLVRKDQLPQSDLVTRLCNNLPLQDKSEGHCDYHQQKQGNCSSKLRPPEDLFVKTAAIHVPLSSKYQLRSRIKYQSQESA